ncbi:hypothetical protein [Nocardia abscessus]|uniref:hypothetical protein n=1 Tax=Nocardia abscessus TaxID=120957 RepID=UPI0024589686|nr:hypothetical protein [Nocardia abscessus]
MDRQVPLRNVIVAIGRAHPDSSLDQLAAAVIHAAHWLRLADQLLDHFVVQARHAGMPWAEVGVHLGVSRQAAQKRFATRVAERHAAATRL